MMELHDTSWLIARTVSRWFCNTRVHTCTLKERMKMCTRALRAADGIDVRLIPAFEQRQKGKCAMQKQGFTMQCSKYIPC